MNLSRKRQNVIALLGDAVERTPDHTAIVDLETGERLTYRELNEEVTRVANGLQSRGVEHGDRVAICLRNRPEHVVTFLATQAIGAVAVPFNFRLAREGVRYAISDADPAVTITGPDVATDVEALHDEVSCDTYVAVDEPAPDVAISFDALRSDRTELPETAVQGDDLSVIQYSSGTTGDPKGIQITHEGTVARTLVDGFGQRFRMETEVMLGVMPLYHTVGLHGILLTMIATSGTYVGVRDFDPERVVPAIEREGVTAFHEAPTIFRRLLETDAIERTDCHSVRVVTYSGAPMDSTLLDRVIDVFDPDFVSNQYGCTEAYAPLSQFDLTDRGTPTETGTANLLQRTRIVDVGENDPTATVEPGDEGELIVHTGSPTTFAGYWNKPEATESSVHDGWFFTGDVAYRTGEGRTVITGRADDMIISGGENIAPADVEDVLSAHSEVDDVGVIGVPDQDWGEVPKAFVVCPDDTDVGGDDLDQWCLDSDQLPDFKRPRAYSFVDELPRNPSGKVLRYQLREREGVDSTE